MATSASSTSAAVSSSSRSSSIQYDQQQSKDIIEKLYDSLKSGNVSIVKNILTQNKSLVNSKIYGYEGADIYATSESITNRCYTYTGRETDGYFYPLHIAASLGSKTIVQILLKFGANSSYYDYKDCLPESKCNGTAIHAFYESKGLKFEVIDRYEGEYDQYGLRSGQGILYHKPEGYLSKESLLYRGGFKNGQYNGYGTLYYEKNYDNKTKNDNDNDNDQYIILHYVGRFKDSLMHGRGILFNEKGQKVYRGSFHDGIREGRGEEYEDNIRLYKGEFSNGFRHGFGICYFAEGHRFMGRFDKGNMSGLGYYSFPNGERYEGMYFNNKFEGPGSFYRSSGPIHAIWSKGNVQKELSTPFIPLSVDIPEKKETSILNAFIYGNSDNDDNDNDNNNLINSISNVTNDNNNNNNNNNEVTILQKLKKTFQERASNQKEKENEWKIILATYLNISKNDAKFMGLTGYFNEEENNDDNNENEKIDDNDDDEFLNHDDEVTRFHFVNCPYKNLLTAFVYVSSIQKVFEGRLASTSLHEAVPDFEEIYHLVIDAVDSYNDTWEIHYKQQLEDSRLQDHKNKLEEMARLEEERKEKAKYQYIEPPVTKRASVSIAKRASTLLLKPVIEAEEVPSTNIRESLLDDKRRLFMSSKEKREEEIIKQRDELQAKSTHASLDRKIEIIIGKEIIERLETDLKKLIEVTSNDSNNNNNNIIIKKKTNEFADELLYLMKIGNESLPSFELFQ